MGLLDDAIREHLDLKRRRGADPAEIERAEREALGPVRREPVASEAVDPERLELAGDAVDQPLLDEPQFELDAPRGGLGDVEPLGLGADPLELGPDEPHDEADESRRRHGSGGRSLFGRLRRGGETERADEEPAGEPLGHEDLPASPAPAAREEEPWDDEFEEEDDLRGPKSPRHEGPGTVAFHPPSEWEDEPRTAVGDLGATHPDAPEPAVPPPHRADPYTPAGPSPTRQPDPGETVEYHLGSEVSEEPEEELQRRRPPGEPDEDVLEETPEFLQDTPDHDRLWFEQRPPRDFDFDG